MIITDKGVRANGLLNPIEAAFSTTDAVIGAIFDDVPPDSSLEVVRKQQNFIVNKNVMRLLQLVVVQLLIPLKQLTFWYLRVVMIYYSTQVHYNLSKPLKPFFVIPTTSGTGSEVTMVAVVSDLEKNVKIPFTSYYLMPHAAILDPRMTQTLPPHLTAMTAMDAMTLLLKPIRAWLLTL